MVGMLLEDGMGSWRITRHYKARLITSSPGFRAVEPSLRSPYILIQPKLATRRKKTWLNENDDASKQNYRTNNNNKNNHATVNDTPSCTATKYNDAVDRCGKMLACLSWLVDWLIELIELDTDKEYFRSSHCGVEIQIGLRPSFRLWIYPRLRCLKLTIISFYGDTAKSR